MSRRTLELVTDDRARVSQAVGMVSVQADCTPDEALVLMRERAQIEHVSLWALAAGIIDRVIRFN